jgi:uncharacterized membrane protein YGL010W
LKTLDAWLDEYGESHRNPVNKNIHWVCVPIIQFCVLGLLYAASPWLALGLIVAAMMFYVPVSAPLAAGLLLTSLLMVALLSVTPHVLAVSAVLFVLAWAGQFYGHRVEGRKPSFFKDLQFLLVGPMWLMSFLYQRLGLPV